MATPCATNRWRMGEKGPSLSVCTEFFLALESILCFVWGGCLLIVKENPYTFCWLPSSASGIIPSSRFDCVTFKPDASVLSDNGSGGLCLPLTAKSPFNNDSKCQIYSSSSGAELWQTDRFEFIVIPDRDSFSGVRPTTSGETWVGYVLVPVSHWARLPAQRLIGKRTAIMFPGTRSTHRCLFLRCTLSTYHTGYSLRWSALEMQGLLPDRWKGGLNVAMWCAFKQWKTLAEMKIRAAIFRRFVSDIFTDRRLYLEELLDDMGQVPKFKER